MGVNLKDLLIKEQATLDDFSGKTIAIDAYNMLYQFLTTIRAPDGNYLTDSKGRITSHLIGLFSRTTALLQKNIKPIFVFDGKPPTLKIAELTRRKSVKQEAEKAYEKATEEQDTDAMKKFASRMTKLTPDLVEDAKELLRLLGVPIVQAPSEGEAQCVELVHNGDAWAVASQDYDALLYGTPVLLRNISIAGRRRKIRGRGTITVKPELIDFAKNLEALEITQEQLIIMAILIGTDYNNGGVRGIGPKKALALVKEHKTPEAVFAQVEWVHETPWQDIFTLFNTMPVTKDYDLSTTPVDVAGLQKFLVDERNFSTERVNKALDNIQKANTAASQKGLGDFF